MASVEPLVYDLIDEKVIKKFEGFLTPFTEFLEVESKNALERDDHSSFVDVKVLEALKTRNYFQASSFYDITDGVPVKDLESTMTRIAALKDFSKAGNALKKKRDEILSWMGEQGTTIQGDFDPKKVERKGKVELLDKVSSIDVYEKPYYVVNFNNKFLKTRGSSVSTPNGKKFVFLKDMNFMKKEVDEGNHGHEDLTNVGCLLIDGIAECKFTGKNASFTINRAVLSEVTQKEMKKSGLNFIGYDESKNAKITYQGYPTRTYKDYCTEKFGEPCWPRWARSSGMKMEADEKEGGQVRKVSINLDMNDEAISSFTKIFSLLDTEAKSNMEFKKYDFLGA